MGDGELDAFKYGGDGRLRNAIVLDVGLERVEEVDLGVGGRDGSLEGAEQVGGLLVHGSDHVLSARARTASRGLNVIGTW